jgi:hypothetical protein
MSKPPSVEEILSRCAAAYANCRTYQDTGESTAEFVRGPGPRDRHTQRRPFRTFFQRPDRLYFEYSTKGVGPENTWHRTFIVTNEKDGFEWSTLRTPELKREEPRTTLLALATLTGVSGGPACFAPFLLLPHLDHFPLPYASTTTFVGREDVDGHGCYRLHGQGKDARVSELWIDADQMAVRRLRYTHTFDDAARMKLDASRAHLARMRPDDDPMRVHLDRAYGRNGLHPSEDFASENVLTLSPRFNVDIDPRVFEFNPSDEQR